MASKKSSAVPNNPITGVLAPRASRYLGRNFFHSSSPKPRRKTALDAAVTLRSRLKNSRRRAPGRVAFSELFDRSKTLAVSFLSEPFQPPYEILHIRPQL